MDPVTAGLQFGKAALQIADDLFTSDEERSEAEQKMLLAKLRAAMEPDQAQVAAYIAEMRSGHRGWRHQLGIILSLAVGMHFVAFPLITVLAQLFGYTAALPDLDIEQLWPLLLGMLGLGGLRSYDLRNGSRK